VDLDLDPSLPHVPCLAGEFNQVIVNMLVNASHAISDHFGNSGEMGLISVTTREQPGNVVITISDNGTGMPEDVRGHIFDPFYTTKQVGKGTGQGLTIAHDVIVRRHGGSISVVSSPGSGTSFTLTLPLVAETGEEAA
jgi:signal transduction histidine kinase